MLYCAKLYRRDALGRWLRVAFEEVCPGDRVIAVDESGDALVTCELVRVLRAEVDSEGRQVLVPVESVDLMVVGATE